MRNDRKLTRETKVQLNNPTVVLNKVLYGEAPSGVQLLPFYKPVWAESVTLSNIGLERHISEP